MQNPVCGGGGGHGYFLIIHVSFFNFISWKVTIIFATEKS